MILENKYLTKAIQKAGYVVMVKTCYKSERKSKLEYISPNANELGMNAELLNKGLKLSEDYIHPEDRQRVITTVVSAIDNGVSDYVHEYRMVGDDGHLYNVINEICITEPTDDKFVVEFYMRNADNVQILTPTQGTEPDTNNEVKIEKSLNDRSSVSVDLSQNKRLKNMFDTFSKIAKLYTVFVDTKCNIVCPPTGPATNLGDFYDLFEKPAYKEYYKYIMQIMEEKNEPMILDREEGGVGKIAAAPIKINKEIAGYWIIGSYTEEETEKLKSVYLHQWETAELMSEFIYQKEIIASEVAKSRGAGAKLREELDRQNIINTALTKSGSKLIDSVDEAIEETLKEVGVNLNATSTFMYIVKSSYHKHNRIRLYWNITGKTPDESLSDVLADKMYYLKDEIAKDGIFIADGSSMTEKVKLILMRLGAKAAVGVPIYRANEVYGILFFADTKTERVWSKEEVRFMRSIAIIVQNMLEDAEGDDNVRKVNKHLIEAYNNFKAGIFVKDTNSGKVLFSNTSMNNMIGHDFVGGDSRTIIKDLHDRFDNVGGMRKQYITSQKVANWRSYIQALDGIMDITEVQIEWLDGEPASLIILRKAKDLQ